MSWLSNHFLKGTRVQALSKLALWGTQVGVGLWVKLTLLQTLSLFSTRNRMLRADLATDTAWRGSPYLPSLQTAAIISTNLQQTDIWSLGVLGPEIFEIGRAHV